MHFGTILVTLHRSNIKQSMATDLNNSKNKNELLQFLWDRRYSLDDVGLSAKNIFDWSKQGLLLDPIKPKARRKYSILEFVWLKLVVGLREFGMSLDSIRNLRSQLLVAIDTPVMFEVFRNPDNKADLIEALGEQQFLATLKALEKMKEGISEQEYQEMFSTLRTPEMYFMSTLFSILAVKAVLYKKDVHLFIDKDGNTHFAEAANIVNPTVEELTFLMQPHIKYSLRSLLGDFLQQDDLISEEETIHYQLLSKKEYDLIEILKKENLVSLTVRLDQHQQIKLIETEENIEVNNARGKITDFLMRNNYQEIVCKTQDGKVTSLRRKTKYK